MYIYLILLAILLYVIIKEREMLGCKGLTEDCDNYDGKPFKGTQISKDDTEKDIYDKLLKTASYTRQVVYWRRTYILTITIVLAMYWISYLRWPTERELVMSMFIVFSIIYFSFNFYQFHLNDVAENKIGKMVDMIR